jgi:Na+-transporting NADH:ubiquinone oxidoreductase subunit C
MKNQFVTGLLAFLFGGIGLHKFYLGRVGQGLLYLLFCWTGIPSIIGFIEGILIWKKSEQEFQDYLLNKPSEGGSTFNTNSNAYIIIYSAILVVIVAFLLAFVYQALKPMQDANVALDVKKQILYSLNIRDLDGAAAEAKYKEVVKEEGEKDGQKYYLCEIDGEDILVVALKGMGLWGGISGYISIHGDETPTVYGAYFNHESETAGLGAEIKDSQAWQEKFIGKKVFVDGTQDVALSVVKKVEDPATQVDCVTGATLTSNGVNDMIKAGLKDAGKNAVELFLKMQCTKDEPADTTAVEPKAEEE